MKKTFMFPVMILTLLCMFTQFVWPQGKAFAEIADGTYSVNYQILQAQNDSVSMANDYFEKPATLIVENGVKYIQFTLSHSDWIKELQAPRGGSFADVNVISANKSTDKRTVKFKVEDDLSKPLPMKMHVLIESMDPVYDHKYTVRYDFDIENMKTISAGAAKTNTAKTNANGKQDSGSQVSAGGDKKSDDKTKDVEQNPKTGDNTPILLFVVVLLVSGVVLARKFLVVNTK